MRKKKIFSKIATVTVNTLTSVWFTITHFILKCTVELANLMGFTVLYTTTIFCALRYSVPL